MVVPVLVVDDSVVVRRLVSSVLEEDPGIRVEPLDVVLCRDVLTYSDTATRQQVPGRIARVLRRTGSLVIGAAGTTLDIGTAFERLQSGRASCDRVRGSGRDPS